MIKKPEINCLCEKPGMFYKCREGTEIGSERCNKRDEIYNTLQNGIKSISVAFGNIKFPEKILNEGKDIEIIDKDDLTIKKISLLDDDIFDNITDLDEQACEAEGNSILIPKQFAPLVKTIEEAEKMGNEKRIELIDKYIPSNTPVGNFFNPGVKALTKLPPAVDLTINLGSGNESSPPPPNECLLGIICF